MPPELPPVFRLVLGLYARRLGLTFEQFEAYAAGREPWPPGMLDAILETFEPLTSSHDLATLASPMQAPDVKENRQTRVSRARLGRVNRKHPFVVALIAKGLTVTEFAKDIGYARSTVQSWYDRDADNARPIPRKAAADIEKKLGIPVSAWAKTTD